MIKSYFVGLRIRCCMTITILIAVALAGAGCSSAPNAAPDASAVIQPDAQPNAQTDAQPTAIGCTDPDPGALDFIDNMEDGNALISIRGGRNGSWYTFHDPTTGVLNPDMGTVVEMEMIPEARCGVSNRSIRVTGSGFNQWGSGFGFSFRSVQVDGVYTTAPYDASAARGITFWARIGETSVNTIRMGIGDEWSVPLGGHCDVTQTAGSTACWDHFGESIALTPLWTRYTFQFGELQQRSFGMPRPALAVAAVHFVEFTMPAGAPVFDIWVDDVSLF
jgi:hypothetical protein